MNHILKCHEIIKTDFIRGRDCYLFDVQGRRYTDFEAGVWCTALGHGHGRINQTIRTQIEQLVHIGYRYTGALADKTAALVLDTVALPDGKCVFLNSGSEAVEFGVQVTRRITGRPLLLTLSDSYLAAYGSAASKSPHEWYTFDWRVCVACHHSDECDPQCSHLREIPFESIGGLVFEPGNSSGLVKLPPRQLVETLANLVRQDRGHLLVDEVTTGLGRTGTWFGFQHYAIRPDIIAMGKGLGNGYPVSAVVMARDVVEELENSPFHYVQSHQNDPLGCAIAKEVVTVIQEEGLVERSNRVGTHFLRELKRLAERHSIVRDTRGRGLMIAVEFASDDGRFSVGSVYRDLFERGFLVGYSPAASVLRFYPALTIGEDDITQLLENLDRVLENNE